MRIKEVWPILIFFSRSNIIIKMCIMFKSFIFLTDCCRYYGRLAGSTLILQNILSYGRSQSKFVTFDHLKLRPFFPLHRCARVHMLVRQTFNRLHFFQSITGRNLKAVMSSVEKRSIFRCTGVRAYISAMKGT